MTQGMSSSRRDVVRRVALDGDRGRRSSPGATRPIRSSQRSSSAAQSVGRTDRVERGLSQAYLVGELAGVQAVRVDAAVGAERDAYARLDALGEAVALDLRGLVVLAEHVGGPAVRRRPCSAM